MGVKVRIGIALGGYGDAGAFTAAVDRLEIANDWADARRMVEQYVDACLSKFVVRPATVSPAPGGLRASLGRFADEMMPLQT